MRISDWSSDVCSSDLVAASVVIAATARHSAQNIAFHEVGRQAVMADPNWRDGDYYYADSPAAGLAVARMAAHITYLSEAGGTDLYPQEAVGRLGPVRRGQGQGHPRRARLDRKSTRLNSSH